MHSSEHGIAMGGNCLLARLTSGVECPSIASSFGEASYHAQALKTLATSLFFLVLLFATGLACLVRLVRDALLLKQLARSRLFENLPVLEKERARAWLSRLEHSPTFA